MFYTVIVTLVRLKKILVTQVTVQDDSSCDNDTEGVVRRGQIMAR
jgi:hypothetical protein